MSTAQQLHFELEEPGVWPLEDKLFDILRIFLQPDTNLSMDDVSQQITDSLPEGSTSTQEVGIFVELCIELAEQIPCNHQSMHKLVSLIYVCLNSPRLNQRDEKHHRYRYDQLFRVFDCHNGNDPSENASKFVNFETFVALLFCSGMATGPFPLIYHILVQTFGKLDDESFLSKKSNHKVRNDRTWAERNAWIQASAQWILLQGHVLYAGIEQEVEHEIEQDKPKAKTCMFWRKSSEAVATAAPCRWTLLEGHSGFEMNTRDKLYAATWKFWREKFEAIAAAAGENEKQDGTGYSLETGQLARQAAIAMATFEEDKIG